MMFTALLSTAGVIVVLFSTLCRSQQAPFYNTTKFANVTHRRDICDRQRLLFADKIELPNALQGLNLSVVLTNYKDPDSKHFFTLVNGVIDEKEPGIFAVIMDELAQRAGFSWRDSFGVVEPIDAKVDGNQTWSDLLEWEVNAYDISMGKWDHSPARMKREISFPEGWSDSSVILVEWITSDYTEKVLDLWSFLSPFQWGVWLLIVATVICTGFVYFLLERMNAGADDMELENKPTAAVFYSAITMTGHYEFRPQTHPARLLTFSLTLFALLIVAVYTANLVSFLVIRQEPRFEIESVEQAVLLRAPICVQARVAIDEYLSSKYPKAILVRKPDEKEVILALKNDECEVAAMPISSFDEYQRNPDVNGKCSLSWQGRTELIVPSGIATIVDTGVLCSSLVSYVLDFHLNEMKGDGFLEWVWKEHLQKISDHTCIDTSLQSAASGMAGDADDEEYSLGIRELAGIFIIHVILTALAVLLALWSIVRPDKDREVGANEANESEGCVQGLDGSSDPTTSTEQLQNGGHSDQEGLLREEP